MIIKWMLLAADRKYFCDPYYLWLLLLGSSVYFMIYNDGVQDKVYDTVWTTRQHQPPLMYTYLCSLYAQRTVLNWCNCSQRPALNFFSTFHWQQLEMAVENSRALDRHIFLTFCTFRQVSSLSHANAIMDKYTHACYVGRLPWIITSWNTPGLLPDYIFRV